MHLPVLFVCEDNGYAIDTKPEVIHGFKRITGVARQFESSVFEEDSTDVEVLYDLTTKAIDSIKADGRPSFLLLKCYRYLQHVGVDQDFDDGYRSRAEYEEWLLRDSISLQRNRLLNIGWTEPMLVGEERRIDAHLEESLIKAQAAPFPQPEELYTGVFHEKP